MRFNTKGGLMLIQFSVGNFRSFKELATLSMVAANTNARDPLVNQNNTIKVNEDLTLLTSAAIYGANASGKSNLVHAFTFMRQLTLESSKESQVEQPLGVEPFRLSTETENEPSFFEAVLITDGSQYRYGFEVNNKEVVSEWLFSFPGIREAKLFVRERKDIKISPRYFKEGKNLEQKTRSNALFLSVVAQFNGEISQSILRWFSRAGIVSGLDDMSYRGYTIQRIMEGEYKSDIIQLVKSLDIDIDDIRGIKLDMEQIRFSPDMPEELRSFLIKSAKDNGFFTVQTVHTKFDSQGQKAGVVIFDMDNNESHGTQKVFYLGGPIMDVLKHGKVMVIDEMEARLHPHVTKALIRLFNSVQTNPNRAQLIFTTHDTNLLSNKIFRRDQIWFTEKDKKCGSHLYSLAEIKKTGDVKVRNDASFEEDYLKGRYGAIPFLGGVKKISLGGENNNGEE
jgi:AAA15 family ATPase/GTPase